MTNEDQKKPPMFNTIIGQGAPESFSQGFGNTYMGATDARGNAIYNMPMSVGYMAGYAPGSIIVGAFAGMNMGKRSDKPESE